jgi:hypothetical protein
VEGRYFDDAAFETVVPLALRIRIDDVEIVTDSPKSAYTVVGFTETENVCPSRGEISTKAACA